MTQLLKLCLAGKTGGLSGPGQVRLLHRGQNFVERQCREGCCVVRHPVGDNELPAAEETATGINDVGDVAFSLILVWLDQGLAQAADDFGRIVQIEQESANTILSHRSNSVADHEPAGLSFNR